MFEQEGMTPQIYDVRQRPIYFSYRTDSCGGGNAAGDSISEMTESTSKSTSKSTSIVADEA